MSTREAILTDIAGWLMMNVDDCRVIKGRDSGLRNTCKCRTGTHAACVDRGGQTGAQRRRRPGRDPANDVVTACKRHDAQMAL